MSGLIISRRPVAVVLRERWERAMERALCRRDLETVAWLARVYDELETAAEAAGRN